MRRKASDIPPLVVAYLLMLPDLCEADRRLQSGKRHARFDPDEMLDLRVELPVATGLESLVDRIMEHRFCNSRPSRANDRASIRDRCRSVCDDLIRLWREGTDELHDQDQLGFDPSFPGGAPWPCQIS